jgi:hypothetical protein
MNFASLNWANVQCLRSSAYKPDSELTRSRGVASAHVEHDLFHVVLRPVLKSAHAKKGGNAEDSSRRRSSVLTPPRVCWKVTQTGAFKRKDVHLGSRFWRLVTPRAKRQHLMRLQECVGGSKTTHAHAKGRPHYRAHLLTQVLLCN